MIANIFSFLFPSRCLGCGTPDAALCERCIILSRKSLSTPEPYITSLFDFKDPLIRRAIHAIKYHHRKDLIAPLALALAKELGKTVHEESILVPVPMPAFRKFMRGYNQAELIAEVLGKELGLPVWNDVLTRNKISKRQAMIATRSERLRNQNGSFAADNKAHHERFIVVDDVTTTGATLKEARKALLQKKASHVEAVTLAH